MGCSWDSVKQSSERAVNRVWRPKTVLLDVPHLLQMPELPRGCEVTSLAMMLYFKGIQVDKMELAQRLKRDPAVYRKVDGEIWFGNPHVGFVGDMYSFDRPGLGVYHEPIVELANQYIPNAWKDITGVPFEEIELEIANGNPVWVIVTSTFDWVDEKYWETWNTEQGVIKVTKKEHAVVITGYDEEFVYVNDPLTSKNKQLPKEAFIRGWSQMGAQAVTLY